MGRRFVVLTHTLNIVCNCPPISNDRLEDLPGQFAVWAASEEAKFLHGRFVWAKWDVNELRQGKLREMIDNDPEFLQVNVKGM